MISFMILGGAGEDGLDATEPPEPTIVPESIGLGLLPVPAGLHLVLLHRARPGPVCVVAGWGVGG